jgi:hypothetical protein
MAPGDEVNDESHGRFTKADIARELARVSRQLTDSKEGSEEAEDISAEAGAPVDTGAEDAGVPADEEMPPSESQAGPPDEERQAFVPRTRRRTSRPAGRSAKADEEPDREETPASEDAPEAEAMRSPEDNGGHDRGEAPEPGESRAGESGEVSGPADQQFGRRKVRKGSAATPAPESRDEAAPSDDKPPQPPESSREEAEEFAEPEKIAFGRGPKRRS